MQKMMDDELLYFKNKIEEETMNITLWVEKIRKVVTTQVESSLQSMMANWKKYYTAAMKQMDTIDEYEQILDFFEKGDWRAHEHVDKAISFLYSE